MKLDPVVREKYPGFVAGYVMASGVTVEPTVEKLEERKQQVLSELKAKLGTVDLAELPEIKAHRDFFSAMGVDPSSHRPAPEYLLRRALDNRFPSVNNVVDSCLLATVEHMVSVSVHDLEKVKGELRTTLATDTVPFELIDGRKVSPRPGEVILRDDQRVLSAYTAGDAKAAMITYKTSRIAIVVWNAPGIPRDRVEAAVNSLAVYARRYCGGYVEHVEVL
ncbi:MAG: phenylalanine--tRNA ligase beta subunit-related protein [Candidatus Hadarchaeum sp.]